MQNQLQKAINLSKKTGDRIIVVDTSRGGDAYVVMSLNEYERTVVGQSEVRGLTEDELLDKINRDIAVWKSENAEENFENYNKYEDLSESEEEDTYYYEESSSDSEEENDFDYRGLIEKKHISEGEIDNFNKERSSYNPLRDEEKKYRNLWKIPPSVKEGAEEII